MFEPRGHDLRAILRLVAGRTAEPSAAIFDSRTLHSPPERGTRAGYDGAKRRRDSTVHMAVERLGHLLAVHVTAAPEQDRSQVCPLAEKGQEVTGDSVVVAVVDQGDGGAQAAQDAEVHHMRLEVVKLPKQKEVVFCCPNTGSWSAARRGRRVFAVWRGIMNSWPGHWQACILLRSLF